ncbi:unnamed protein product, partial [Brenthis ino]
MFGKKPLTKSANESSTSGPRSKDAPEVALAAIVSYKKQKEVSDFMSFFLGALERNSDWLNGVVGKQTNFRCAVMTGAGPNRFQLQEIMYPTDEKDIKLEVEHRDSEDYDKIAIAALLTLNNSEKDHILKYIKTRLCDNSVLTEDLLKAKELGVHFAILIPFADKQYRVMERLIIGASIKCDAPLKKRRRDEKSIIRSPLKKAKRVA